MKFIIEKQEMDFIKKAVIDNCEVGDNFSLTEIISENVKCGTTRTLEDSGSLAIDIRSEFLIKLGNKFKKYLYILIPAYKSIFATYEILTVDIIDIIDEEEELLQSKK